MDIDKQEDNVEIQEIETEQEVKGFAFFKIWIIRFPVTALCMAIALVLFALVSYSTYFENTQYPENLREYLAYIKYGAVLNDITSQQYLWEGELWRIFVNLFHHGGALHIFFNLYALYFFGSFAEKYMGSIRYLFFIIFCGLSQEIICQLTIEKGAIGLSGIIYGLFGLLFIIRKSNPIINSFISPELTKAMFVQLFIFMGLTYFNIMNIANVGHVAGLVYGILFSLAFYKNTNLIKKIAFILLNMFIISGLYYIYLPNTPEWQTWYNSTKS